VGDFDGDGRADLVVTQNGGATRLFRNAAPKSGLRVRLKGPPTNPDGLGAIMSFESAGLRGPAREVRGGSGYWSQDSAVQVLAVPSQVTQLVVRWPGGRTTTNSVSAGAKSIVVDHAGAIESR